LVRLNVNATDAAGATLSQPLTIVINPAAFSIPAGKVSVSFSQALPAIDALPAGTYSFALANGSTLPPGLQLSGSGTISGTPTGSGGYSFVIKATDSASVGGPFVYSLSCSVTIAAPTLTITPSVPGGNVATPYSQTLAATGGTAPYAFSVTAGTLPPGLSLTTAGLLSGIPTTEGDYKFTATAVDSTTGGGPFSISNDYEVVIDYVPVLGSNPIAFSQLVPGLSINSLVTNLTAVFSAVVSPSDAVISWDFGDSSPIVTGSTALHSYAAAGSFTVTVSAKNPRTASTTTATLTVDVSEGGALTGSEKLLVRNGTIALSSKINLIVLSESIQLGQGEKISGATLTVSVNGVTQTFVLNAMGQSKSATGKAHLAFKSKRGKITAQTATLSVKISGATIPAGLKAGVDLNASGDPTKALLQTVFNGRTMTSITALSFKKTRHSNIAHFSSH
jgi:PKD repeat protein